MAHTVFDKTACLHIETRIWSAKKKVEPSDVDLKKYPPEALATLGYYRLLDDKDLFDLRQAKNQAHGEARRTYFPFLGGYAGNIEDLDGLVERIRTYKAAFDAARTDLLDSLEDRREAWCEKHPDWSDMIAKHFPTRESLETRIHMTLKAFQIQATQMPISGTESAARGLMGSMVDDVVHIVNDIWSKPYAERVRIGRSGMKPWHELAKKLESLSYIDPKIRGLHAGLSEILSRLPADGQLEPSHRQAMDSLCFILSDAGRLSEYAERLCESITPIEAPKTTGSLWLEGAA